MRLPKLLAALAVLVLVLFSLSKLFWSGSAQPNTSLYQAIALTNGQLYFGKLTLGKRNFLLREVYYIQSSPAQKAADSDQKPDTRLIKRGEEIHGPEDAMYIEKDNVLYWENLKDNGKVAQTIAQYKAQQAGAGNVVVPSAGSPSPTPIN